MSKLYVCPRCGCPDVEGTAWIELNSDKVADGEPPTDDYWCPRCQDHPAQVCLVDVATGKCSFHGGCVVRVVE